MLHNDKVFMLAEKMPFAAVEGRDWQYPPIDYRVPVDIDDPRLGVQRRDLNRRSTSVPFRTFAHAVMMPEDLDDITGHVEWLVKRIHEPSYGPNGEAEILLRGGMAGLFTTEDVGHDRHIPKMVVGHDFRTDATRRVAQLFMPTAYAEARSEFVNLLNCWNVGGIIDLLERLHDVLPQAAIALLELRFRDAAGIIRATNQIKEWREVQDQMIRLIIINWMVRRAMACAAVLHRPYSFEPLDSADREDSVRNRPVFARVMSQLMLVENVLAQYRLMENRAEWADALKTRASSVAFPVEISEQWFCAPDLKRRALAQLAVWRAKHGSDLEAVIAREIDHARKQVAPFRHTLEAMFPTQSANKRIANMKSINALEALFHEIRIAMACLSKNGFPKLAAWIEADGRASTFPDLPKNCSKVAGTLHSLFRYAIIDDDEALPKKFRCTKIRTQADAVSVLGHRIPFSDIWDTFNGKAEKRSAIVSAATKGEKADRKFPDPELRRLRRESRLQIADCFR